MPASSAQSVHARLPAPQPLQGCRLGLVCGSGDSDCAQLFLDVAQALGAEVALLRTSDVVMTSEAQTDKLARLLAQLYDAIECQDLPTRVVQRLAQAATIPVFNNLAAAHGAGSGPPTGDVGDPAAHLQAGEDAMRVGAADAQEQRSERLRQALLRALSKSDLG